MGRGERNRQDQTTPARARLNPAPSQRTPTLSQAILVLQRAVGNQAVVRGRGRVVGGARLQRMPPPPAPGAAAAPVTTPASLYNFLMNATPDPVQVATMAGQITAGGIALDSWRHPNNGDMLLGIAAKWTNDAGAAMQALINAGATVDATDARGRSAVHYAAFQGKLHNVQWLVTHGARADARDAAGWTPYDVAAAAGEQAVAAHLAPLQHTADQQVDPSAKDPRQLELAPGPHSAPEILAAATKSMDPSKAYADFLAMYQELYQYADLRPILETAALEARTSRAVNQAALRIYLSDTDAAHELRKGGGHGSYNDMDKRDAGGGITQKREGTITSGGTRPPESGVSAHSVMLGTLIHELTHHAAMKVFANNNVPVQQGDVNGLDVYLAGYRSDAAKAMTKTLAPKTAAAREIGFEKIQSYQSLALKLPEIVVRPPQTLIMFGEVAEHALPGETAFFRSTFLPAVQAYVATHPNAAQMSAPGAPGRADFSDRGTAETVQVNAIGRDQLADLAAQVLMKKRVTVSGFASDIDKLLIGGSDIELVGFNPATQAGAVRSKALHEVNPGAEQEQRLKAAVRKAWPKKPKNAAATVPQFDALLAALAKSAWQPVDKACEKAVALVVKNFLAQF